MQDTDECKQAIIAQLRLKAKNGQLGKYHMEGEVTTVGSRYRVVRLAVAYW